MIAKKRVLPMLIALLLAGGASVAHACDWDYRGYGYDMGPGMMGPGMMGPGMMGAWGMGRGMMGPGMTGAPYGGVDLTDDQNAKMTAVQEEFSKKQWDVMNQMHDEQFKLQQLYSAPTRDNAAINEQYKKVNQLRRQMWDNMADAQKKTEAVLTTEQRSTMRRRGGRHMMWGW